MPLVNSENQIPTLKKLFLICIRGYDSGQENAKRVVMNKVIYALLAASVLLTTSACGIKSGLTLPPETEKINQ